MNEKRKIKALEEMLPIVEKIFPHNYEIQTSYFDPLIEILKTTLPISVALLLGSLSLEIDIKYIIISNTEINPFLLITAIQVVCLYLLLHFKKRIREELNKAMREMYWDVINPLYRKFVANDIVQHKKIKKDIQRLKTNMEKLRYSMFKDISPLKIIAVAPFIPTYLRQLWEIKKLEDKLKKRNKFLEKVKDGLRE